MVCRVRRGAFGQAIAGDEQLGPPPGRREIQCGTLAGFGRAAFDPVVSAEVAPFGVEVDGARGQAGTGHHDHLGELEARLAG
jgi:hypothetical protein